jgi:hypothetical protein
MHNLNRGKKLPKNTGYFCNFEKKLSKVNNIPMGENSCKLVTLVARRKKRYLQNCLVRLKAYQEEFAVVSVWRRLRNDFGSVEGDAAALWRLLCSHGPAGCVQLAEAVAGHADAGSLESGSTAFRLRQEPGRKVGAEAAITKFEALLY